MTSATPRPQESRHPRYRSGSSTSTDGFTLIEVMMSGSILLLGLAAVITAMTTHIAMNEHHRHTTQAIHITEGVLEELLLAFPGDDDLAIAAHGPLHFSRQGHQTAAASVYQVNWTVLGSNPMAGMKKVQVTTTWTEKAGPRKYSVYTFRK